MIEGKKIILRAYKESDIEVSFKLINTLNIRTMLGRVDVFPFSMGVILLELFAVLSLMK